jgi:hypothetical protein
MKARQVCLAAAAATGLALGSGAVRAEVCSNTNFGTPFLTGCAGSFIGALVGGSPELALLNATFGDTFTFAGRSDDAGFGPFTANPHVAFNGTLSFDSPVSGVFVLGLVSSGQHSFYRFSTKRRIGGLGFDSLEGVATTPQGNPFALDYAVLYTAVAQVPEPATSLLLAGGVMALLGWQRRRAAQRLA